MHFLGFQGIQPLLEEEIISLSKLQKICLTNEVPNHYKPSAWRVLLGVLPIYRDAWVFVEEQNTISYLELKRATHLIRYGILNEDIDKVEIVDSNLDSRAKLIADIWVTHQSLTFRNTEDDLELSDLIVIARVFCKVCNNEVDAYWSFEKFLCPTYQDRIVSLIERLTAVLPKIDPQLSSFFIENNIKLEYFCDRWLRTRFASCFSENFLLRLWDKVIASSAPSIPNRTSQLDSFEILLSISILIVSKNQIYPLDASEIPHYLRNKKFEEAEAIFAKTLDLYSVLLNEDKNTFNSKNTNTQQQPSNDNPKKLSSAPTYFKKK
uniref:TBC1 domain family member 7 n=1 Tax=Arcella intermedia TaxID=1963864 RepID=A0A6B2LAI4_9EUKA